MPELHDKLLATVKLVLKIAVPYPLRRSFDYLPPEGVDPRSLRPGVRVKVPFGKHNTIRIGYLLGVDKFESGDNIELKQAISVLDDEPLIATEDFAILLWASRYYHHPLGEVIASAFPVLLRQGRPAAVKKQRLLCLTESRQGGTCTGTRTHTKSVVANSKRARNWICA